MNPLLEKLAISNPEALFVDGFEDAFIGICMRYGQEALAAYDYNKCIEILVRDGMSEDDAIEYFEFNVIGAYLGKNTPVFLEINSEF